MSCIPAFFIERNDGKNMVHKLVIEWEKHGAYFGHKMVLFFPIIVLYIFMLIFWS
nr:MAG TPA: hypothetical protein [Caudoviricetes sp.]